jgi:hypothetical protein
MQLLSTLHYELGRQLNKLVNAYTSSWSMIGNVACAFERGQNTPSDYAKGFGS